MYTIFSYLCLLVLVCVYICGKLSAGIMFPCSKNHTEFHNRTLSARLNASASISICAESNYTVYYRFKITHPNYGDAFYPQKYKVDERLSTSVEMYHHQLTVFIKVNNVQLADFNDPFGVTLFSADNGTQLNDDSATIFFVIEESDNDTTTVTTTKIPLTSAESLSDLINTTTWCPEKSVSGHTQELCQVNSDLQVCVWKLPGNSSSTPKDQCASQNASHISTIEILRRCLRSLLHLDVATTSRLDVTKYVDTHNWTDVPPAKAYRVGCFTTSQPLANPVITWFTVELWDTLNGTIIWTHNLLDSNNTSVTIPATKDSVNVTCRAIGYPKPDLVILRDNVTLEMIPSGSLFIRRLNDGYSGVLTCQTTNLLNLEQTHIRVMVSVTANPVITWFTVELWDTQNGTIIWTHNLLYSNNTSVTIPATNDSANVTCRAIGYPKPDVVILRDNVALEMKAGGISLIRGLNDSYSGVLTCQATNVVNLGQTHIRVMVSVTDGKSKNSTQSQTDFWLVVAVGITVAAIALVLICVFFKKKGKNFAAAGRRNTPDCEISDEVVIDNMELYSVGKNEVVIDNMALYSSGKYEENSPPGAGHGHYDNDIHNTYSLASSNVDITAKDLTDGANIYEDVKESATNDDDAIKTTSQQQGFGECRTSHTHEVGSQQSPDRASNNYTQAVKVKNTASAIPVIYL